MKVSELIEKLKERNQDSLVVFSTFTEDGEAEEVRIISEDKKYWKSPGDSLFFADPANDPTIEETQVDVVVLSNH
jgi:hypothetical protein